MHGLAGIGSLSSEGIDDAECCQPVYNWKESLYIEEEFSLDTLIHSPQIYQPCAPATLRTDSAIRELHWAPCPARLTLLASTGSIPRSLVDPASLRDEMTTSITPASCSPPGLTHSRSSSFRTSTLSGVDATLPDLAHFEDISLAKDSRPGAQSGHENDTTKQYLPASSRGTGDAQPNSFRDLTAGDRQSNTQAGYDHGNKLRGLGPAHALTMPIGSSTSRKFSTSSRLARRAMSNHGRSRSPSPSAAVFTMTSPPSVTCFSYSQVVAPPIRTSTNRRGSWQPTRKTAKELEDEYDDMDEDLPDDASLWNVPLSPRPLSGGSTDSSQWIPKVCSSQSRENMNATSSASRDVGLRSSPDLPTDRSHKSRSTRQSVDGSAPDAPPTLRHTSPNSIRLLPDHYSLSNGRAKSWTVAMSELSEDAQHLTEELENLADPSKFRHDINSHVNNLQRTKTSIDLPPLRMSNVMIDPLPISKEKEKVLSRTRPSWLPPKNQKEERKHLREYQRMMEMSLQAGMIGVSQ